MPSGIPTDDALREMTDMCEGYYTKLLNGGCTRDVALDRTRDAFQAALGEVEQCFDARDRLFENRLREVAERGNLCLRK